LLVRIFLDSCSVIICLVYIPPACRIDDYIVLFDSLMATDMLFDNNLLIIGDFNMPDFLTLSQSRGYATTSSIYTHFSRFLDFFNMRQFNEIVNSIGRLLDLVMCNKSCRVAKADDVLVPEDNYHPALEITTSWTEDTHSFPTFSSLNYNFRKADFYSLYIELSSIDWSFLEQAYETESAVDLLYQRLYSVFDKHIPRRGGSLGTYPAWFDRELIYLIRRKYKAWQRYKRSERIHAYNIFKQLRAEVKVKERHAYNNYVNRMSASIKANPKYFWSFVNSIKKSTSIPDVMNYDGSILKDPKDIVDKFAGYFSKSFMVNNKNQQSNQRPTELVNKNVLYLNDISDDDVQKAIKKLKNSQTAGPDQIPSFLLCDCKTIFSSPLKIIFNLIIKTSVFPAKWKESRLCPIFKNGDKSDITNYRPIAIINNFAKIFEFILFERIYHHISSKISVNQHGFMARRSTVTNLVSTTQFLCESLDAHGQVDVIYMDLSKAFDRVNHRLLLYKLDDFGLSDGLILLIESYLQERVQFVQYRGFRSESFSQTSGVPQGSVLGPLFFNIFINDLTSLLNENFQMYADDLKIYRTVSTLDDCSRLQKDLDIIQKWCNDNDQLISTKKCYVLTFSRKLNKIICDYWIGGVKILRATEFRDLGVVFDCGLTFRNHIEYVTSAAYKSLGFVLRNRRLFHSAEAIVSLYKAYVRCKLEYAGIVWSPIYNNHTWALEKIQRHFAKFLVFNETGQYPPRGLQHETLLECVQLHSLASRRDFAKIKFLSDVLSFSVECPYLLSKLLIKVPAFNCRRCEVFQLRSARTNILLMSPLYQMVNSCSTKADSNNIDIFFTRPSELRSVLTYAS
jgi:hypothetical protein